MVRTFADRYDKVALSKLCQWANLPSSVFYYSPSKGKRGAKPSTHTHTKDGALVSNEQVLTDIRTALNREFCCYGYHNITDDLRGMNYVINVTQRRTTSCLTAFKGLHLAHENQTKLAGVDYRVS